MKPLNLLRALSGVLLLACSLLVSAASVTAPAVPGQSRAGSAPADLVVFNRYVTTFRGDFLGISPAERVERARAILQTLAYDTDAKVVVTSIEQGKKITIDGRYILIVIPGDVDPLGQESIDEVAAATAERLKQVIAETREARSVENLNRSLAAGFALNARGAMEIVLATAALESGLINERIFVALFVMALATSILSGPMMKRFLEQEQKAS
jgi:hypothetical protein